MIASLIAVTAGARPYIPEVDGDDDEDIPSGYVPPDQRPGQWAAEAQEMAAAGRTVPQIAAALCVDEATAERLLSWGVSDGGELR